LLVADVRKRLWFLPAQGRQLLVRQKPIPPLTSRTGCSDGVGHEVFHLLS